ncbi:MAG: D-alanine--D-alanine ligase [Burkholderiaceae bacterium]
MIKPRSAMPGKVAVLLGGLSAEREVSLLSGAMVMWALNRKGVAAYAFDPAERPLSDLQTGQFDAAFISLHGRLGEDGTVQGALEMLGIPYTGAGVQASALAIDKVITKQIWIARGLRTPDYRMLDSEQDLAGAWRDLGGPCIVKPAREGSTLGLTKVLTEAEMEKAFGLASTFDNFVIAEQFVNGREFTVAILGEGQLARALPVIEIRAPDGNYDYNNKYFTDETEYLCPAPLPDALTIEIQKLALDAYRALGCQGWGRIDLMLDQSDTPFLLELNTSPGMTDHSLVPMAAKAAGTSYDDLVYEILSTASLKASLSGQRGK